MGDIFVTVNTDGFRNYVDLPDGRQINLGTVSVLKLVTLLVSGLSSCRNALDSFNDKGYATIKVNLQNLENLLQPRRSRWAGYNDLFIQPYLYERGIKMSSLEIISDYTCKLEKCASEIQRNAELGQSSEESVSNLRNMVASLSTFVFDDGKNKVAAVDETAKKELKLYMENEAKLYRQKKIILSSLVRKVVDDKYNHAAAAKLWSYWVDEGAKLYAREFGGDMREIFPKQLREELAKEIANDEKKLIDEGEYDMLKKSSDNEQEQEEKEEQESQQREASVLSNQSINEALAYMTMAKIDSALKVVNASDKSGIDIAKGDLHRISSQLSNLIKDSDLNDSELSSKFTKLANMAEKVYLHFSK